MEKNSPEQIMHDNAVQLFSTRDECNVPSPLDPMVATSVLGKITSNSEGQGRTSFLMPASYLSSERMDSELWQRASFATCTRNARIYYVIPGEFAIKAVLPLLTSWSGHSHDEATAIVAKHARTADPRGGATL